MASNGLKEGVTNILWPVSDSRPQDARAPRGAGGPLRAWRHCEGGEEKGGDVRRCEEM